MDNPTENPIKTEAAVQSTIKVKFSWARVLKIAGSIIGVAAILVGIYFIVTLPKVKIFFADVFEHKKEHYLDCYQEPFYVQVQKAYNSHQAELGKLKDLGAAKVEPIVNKCKGWDQGIEFTKGDVLISADSNTDRKQIEHYLGKDFFGIPYRDQVIK